MIAATMTKMAAAIAGGTFALTAWKTAKKRCSGDVSNYEITADGKKMLVKVGKEYAMIDLPKDKLEFKDEKGGKDYHLKLAGLDMKLDRHAEWAQIYDESWRHMRDFFYAPNMNGVDWKAMHDKYAALVPFVNHRNDLDLSHRRIDRRTEQRPCLCRRRRTTGDAADQTWPARRAVIARSSFESL